MKPVLISVREFAIGRVADRVDGIDHEIGESAPRKAAVVFIVMQIKVFARIVHELFSHSLFRYGKFEGVRLERARIGRTETALYKFAFVGLEHVALADEIVQLTGFYAFTENIVIAEIHEEAGRDHNKRQEEQQEITFRFHVVGC